jgi:hypothetical protein
VAAAGLYRGPLGAKFVSAVPACAPRVPRAPAAKAPSQALLDAFGILRRERTDADMLPKRALDELKRRGIQVADPQSARLLRTTVSGGHAWVVPVADVTPLLVARLTCRVPARPPSAAVRRAAARRARARARGRQARPRRLPRPVPVRPTLVVPATPVPFGPAPMFPVAPPIAFDGKPQEGLVVVADGDAPAGGGGAHKQLIRGLAAPAVEQCAGPKRDLVGVSGIVPDGVGSVFLTSADGTAVKTEVKDNAYAFLVPPATRRDAWSPRYVVWTGGDGTPHVQQVAIGGAIPSRVCRSIAGRRGAEALQLTPSPGLDSRGPLLFAPAPPALRVPSPVRVPKRP